MKKLQIVSFEQCVYLNLFYCNGFYCYEKMQNRLFCGGYKYGCREIQCSGSHSNCNFAIEHKTVFLHFLLNLWIYLCENLSHFTCTGRVTYFWRNRTIEFWASIAFHFSSIISYCDRGLVPLYFYRTWQQFLLQPLIFVVFQMWRSEWLMDSISLQKY